MAIPPFFPSLVVVLCGKFSSLSDDESSSLSDSDEHDEKYPGENSNDRFIFVLQLFPPFYPTVPTVVVGLSQHIKFQSISIYPSANFFFCNTIPYYYCYLYMHTLFFSLFTTLVFSSMCLLFFSQSFIVIIFHLNVRFFFVSIDF